MNSFVLLLPVFLTTVNVWYGPKPAHGQTCDCTRRQYSLYVSHFTIPNKQCLITKAAPEGFKCKCNTNWWYSRCYATALPCVGAERCPGNLADHCACKLGGGNCDGYNTDSRADCSISGFPRPSVAGSAYCDCGLTEGGCILTKAAPVGWKCICFRSIGPTGCDNFCKGNPQQCYVDEICPGNDYSYCGCKQGGGNCDGYPDKPECPSAFVTDTSTCNCNQSSFWGPGLYDIQNVEYETGSAKVWPFKPKITAVKEIPNHTEISQSISFTHQEKVAKTSSYDYTSGIQIDIGKEFKAGIPLLGVGVSIHVTSSFSHSWGTTETTEELVSKTFTCNGVPHKYTQCSVAIRKAKVDVPYVMRVKHKKIPDCVCESNGVWKGTQLHSLQLIAKTLGNCSNGSCDNQ